MDSRLSLFHSDLFLRRNIGTKDQLDDLRKQILETKNTEGTGLTENNPNCWRSNANYQNLDWLMKATQELTMKAAEYYFEMDEFFRGYVTQKRININYWTNVNDAGGGNVLHTHENMCSSSPIHTRLMHSQADTAMSFREVLQKNEMSQMKKSF